MPFAGRREVRELMHEAEELRDQALAYLEQREALFRRRHGRFAHWTLLQSHLARGEVLHQR